MQFTNSSFSLPVPDLVRASFRASLEMLLGTGATGCISDIDMFALAAATLDGGDRKENLSVWRKAFPLGTVGWPDEWCIDAIADEVNIDHVALHDRLLGMLMGWSVKRGWALYQASRKRRAAITPFAFFSVSPSRSSAGCSQHHGCYVPIADAARLWIQILDCRNAFCTCSVVYSDQSGLDSRAAKGWTMRPVTDHQFGAECAPARE